MPALISDSSKSFCWSMGRFEKGPPSHQRCGHQPCQPWRPQENVTKNACSNTTCTDHKQLEWYEKNHVAEKELEKSSYQSFQVEKTASGRSTEGTFWFCIERAKQNDDLRMKFVWRRKIFKESYQWYCMVVGDLVRHFIRGICRGWWGGERDFLCNFEKGNKHMSNYLTSNL